MRRFYLKVRCWLAIPVCYRKYPPDGSTDWWFAMCSSCHRQSEVHERFRGPVPRHPYPWPWPEDLDEDL